MKRKTVKALSSALALCMAFTPVSSALAESTDGAVQTTVVESTEKNDSETTKKTEKESTGEEKESANTAQDTVNAGSESSSDDAAVSGKSDSSEDTVIQGAGEGSEEDSAAGAEESSEKDSATGAEGSSEEDSALEAEKNSEGMSESEETGTSEDKTASGDGNGSENTEESDSSEGATTDETVDSQENAALGETELSSETDSTELPQETALTEVTEQLAETKTLNAESEEETKDTQTYPDGEYGIAIESSYKMFKVTGSSAVVKDGKIVVTIETSSNSYDKIYLGNKEDEDKSPVINGTKKEGDGYSFTFELDKSMMGQTINFVPGKPDGTWYEKNQYTLTIPTVLDYSDGDYGISIESSYKMFKITSSSAVVAAGKVVVTMNTSSASYDRIYLGNKEDDPKTPEIVGTANAEGGYTFVFELDKNLMGQTINFVPGKPDGTWYEKNQYTLTIPLAMTRVESDNQESEESTEPTTEPTTEKTTDTLENGNYNMDVDSNAGMFKVINCVLNVKDGVYTADITLSGTGYDYLYMGTAQQAAAADSSQYIGYTVNANGEYVYTIPVSALDTQISVAAHSVKNDTWYDRGLTFKSETAEKVTVLLQNGEYTVDVTTSTGTMFKVVAAALTNDNGTMTAKITLSGTGYDYLYLGTAEEAAKDQAGWIKYTTNAEGQYVFEIPVAALDQEILLVAHSVKNDTWYERGIIFESSTMKLQNGSETTTETEQQTETEAKANKDPEKESKYEKDLSGGTSRVDNSTGLADGVYTPDSFSWSGGSGRTSISCTKVTVSGGQAYATIVFSSSNYGYVKANGNKYYPTYSGGTSIFTIPVKLNANNTIIGMTTAMSAAHEITYTIYIYIAGADKKSSASDTTVDKNKLSEEAPEIIGLEYQDEAEIEYAEYFKIYYYDQGITMIEVDMATDTDKPEANAEGSEKAADGAEVAEETAEAETELTGEAAADDTANSETAVDADSSEESEETADSTTIISELYQNNVIRYLVVPEGAEVPVGLEKEMILIQTPVESIYTDSEQAKETLEKLNLEDLITAENETPAEKPEYKELILSQCNLAILSDAFLWNEEKEITVDEHSELLYEIAERLTTLGIPAIIDRSADEKSEEASAEWIKVYGEIFGCENLAESLYQEAIQ